MTRLRKLNPPPPGLAPVGATQWTVLLRKAIAKAQQTSDPRLTSLQAALRGGAEKTLRRMSIICEADIDREFGASPK